MTTAPQNCSKKPKLVFFRFKYDERLPSFLLTHKKEQVECLSLFFDVTVITEDCDYRTVCDTYEPDLVLFESGVNHPTCRRLTITGTRSNPRIPKLGLHHGDGFCNARAGFLSDMEQWGVETFFSIATTAAEHMPEIADKLFSWPVFVDPSIYNDYGCQKNIPVLFTGSRSQFYPWRQQMFRVVSERYPSLICPHPGYNAQPTQVVVMEGEEYARTLNSSWFVPACGTVAKEVVRKHFEVTASKACLISEDTPGLRAAGFVDMVNCVFADPHTVLDKIQWLFRNPEELNNVIKRGYDAAHSRHTMLHRSELLQWFTLHKHLTSGQKIIQPEAFQPLVVVSQNSTQRSGHITGSGVHLSLIREGDSKLLAGRYDDAESSYLRCLNYTPWLPEAKVRLALCDLYKGDAASALKWLNEPLRFVLDTYGAAEPDPVEWAYLLVAELGFGMVTQAKRHARDYPALHHLELDRARWAVAVVTGEVNIPNPNAYNGSGRPTIHSWERCGFEEWVRRLCVMLAACGQRAMVEALRSNATLAPPLPSVPLPSGKNPAALAIKRTAVGVRSLARNIAVRYVRSDVGRSTSRILHQLEKRYGYFLPYALSDARGDDFFSEVRTVAREEEFATAVLIGAAPGKYSTEAFLAGALENRSKPRVFCVCSSARNPFSRFRAHAREKVAWYRPQSKPTHLAHTVGNIQRNAGIGSFDVVLIDAGQPAGGAGSVSALLESCGAKIAILENLASRAGYTVYRQLSCDPRYLLVCHGPGVQNGFAVFRSRWPAEMPGRQPCSKRVHSQG